MLPDNSRVMTCIRARCTDAASSSGADSNHRCRARSAFFLAPRAQGDGNSSTASPSWRGTRSGWRCPSSAGIAGLWLFPCFSPSRRLSAAGRFGCECWFSFNERVGALPNFYKFFRIMGFAAFSWQIPVSKEVTCLILLNHLLTWCVFRLRGFGAARALLLVLGQ